MLVEPVFLLCVEASCSPGCPFRAPSSQLPEEPEAGSLSALRPGSDTGREGGREPRARWVWGSGQAAGGLGFQRVGRAGASGRWEMWDGQGKGLTPRSSASLTPMGTLPYV